MSKKKSSLILSPGWSHYIITAPLSPKAHISVSKKLRDLSDHDSHFKPLGTKALNIAIMDLGVLPICSEWLLFKALEQGIEAHASLKLQATEFRLSHPQATHPKQVEPAYLWLEFRDRLGALAALYSDIAQHIQKYAPQLSVPAPVSWEKETRFLNEKCFLLCGEISRYKSEVYDQRFSSSVWINEVRLQKRPSHFIPSRGYQSIWRYPLPLETPALSDIDDIEVDSHQIQSPSKIRLKYPLKGEDLSLLKSLEERLELIQSEPVKFNNSKHRHKRRKKRKPSNKSNSSQEKL